MVADNSHTFMTEQAPVKVPAWVDVNEDGQLTMRDVLLLYRHFRGLSPLNASLLPTADVNGDGKVNLQDVLMLYQVFREKVALK